MAGSDYYNRSVANNSGALDVSLTEHMLAITYASNGAITIYRDGVLYANAGTFSLPNSTNEIYLLGRRHDIAVGPASPYFNGAIDEARVYDVALGAQEIAAIYAVGPGHVPAPPVLSRAAVNAQGGFEFSFTNDPGTVLAVLATTNVLWPLSNWGVVGTATEGQRGVYTFTQPASLSFPCRYFRVRWP